MRTMKRKFVFLLLAAVFLAVGSFVDAHAQTAKILRVGVITTLSLDRPHLRGLRDGLEAAGYVVGKNVYLDMTQRKNINEVKSAARGFAKDRYDVLVTTSTSKSVVAQETTREIPIVFMPASAPVKRGLVQSYARPGTNLTGLSYWREDEDNGKLLELLKEMAPKLKSVTVLSDGRETQQFYAERASSFRRVAASLNILFTENFPRNTEDTVAIISGLRKGPGQGVLLNCTTLFADLKRIAARAIEKRIPLQGCSAPHVLDDGALFSYAPDLYQIGRRGAWYVVRILKGATPQNLPVEGSRKYVFVINLKTAHTIGLEIPPEVLQRADRVIE